MAEEQEAQVVPGKRVSHWGAQNTYAYSREEMEYALNGVGPRRQTLNEFFTATLDGVSGWLRRHWLALVNTTLAVWIGVALLTPVAYALGILEPSASIFHVYRFACDQLPSHSFFIAGYQVCLCSRCLAIYSSMLITGLSLALVRKRGSVRGIGWRLWLLAMVPMALDGGTQFLGWRESNNALRVVTGIIFGLTTALFTLPQIESAAHDEPLPSTKSAT